MKKLWKPIVVIAIIFAVVVGSVAVYFTRYDLYKYIWYIGDTYYYQFNIIDFEPYKEDFLAVVKIVEKNVNSEQDYNFLSYGFDKKTKTYYLYSNQLKKRIDLTEKEMKSVENIGKAFTTHEDLYLISFDKNRVSFHIESGHYALVYSADNKKPTYVNGPDENCEVITKKICKNWYHVASGKIILKK